MRPALRASKSIARGSALCPERRQSDSFWPFICGPCARTLCSGFNHTPGPEGAHDTQHDIPTANPAWLQAMLVMAVVAAALWPGRAGRACRRGRGHHALLGARGAQAPEPWRFSGLPNKTPTRFEVVQQGGQPRPEGRGRPVLRQPRAFHPGAAQRLHHAGLALARRRASCRAPTCARAPATTARPRSACSSISPPTGLSFGERTRLALARSTTGEQVPSEALCYVWDNKEAKGTRARERLHPAHAHGGARIRPRRPRPAPG